MTTETASEMHRNRISESDATTESHERTNERTKMSGSDLLISHLGRRASTERLATIGEIIEAGVLPTDERHPVVRTGQRAPIAAHVRSAVWYRDHGRCELCVERSIEGPWHLDHIVPWSAGGSDFTTNLRVLCEEHNIGRSNRIDPTERPRQAATWWCVRCYSVDSKSWSYSRDGMPFCPIHRSASRCRVMGGYRRALELTGEVPLWHRRPPIASPTTTAYCAHCGVPSLTDQPL